MIINIRNVKGSIHSLVFLNLDAKTMYNNNPETKNKIPGADHCADNTKEKPSHFSTTVFDVALLNVVVPNFLTLF